MYENVMTYNYKERKDIMIGDCNACCATLETLM
jgi:hypothetical protein